MNFPDILLNSAAFFCLLPLAVLLLRRNVSSKVRSGLGWVVGLAATTEVLATYLAYEVQVNNLPLLHLYTVVEFTLLLVLAERMAIIGRRLRIWLTVGFWAVAVISAWQWHSIYEMNVVPRSLESVILSILSMVYFFQRLNRTDLYSADTAPAQQPEFWIAVAWLLYFPPGLFIFLYGRWFILENSLSAGIHVVHAMLSIVQYIIYATALWVRAPVPQSRMYSP